MKQKILIYIMLISILGLTLGLNANAQTPTSLVLNYDLTKVDKDLKPGDSGTLIAVIQNTGGLPAKDVKVSILYSSGVSASDTWHLGTINPGQSVTVTTRVNAPANLKSGTYLLTLNIEYKAEMYNSRSKLEINDEESTWKIPIQVYSDANFQIQLGKTEFYKDISSNLVITGIAKGEVRNLNAELKGDCLTIIGSGKEYVGNLGANQNFILNYTIKPNTAGTCSIDISLNYLDNSGKSASETTQIGLSIMEPDVDLKIMDVDFGTASPGDVIELKIKIKNVGVVSAKSVTASLNLDSPFVPVQTSELYIEDLKNGLEKEIQFSISINPDAEIKAYKIPLEIKYKIGGVEYIDNKNIGIAVSGTVNLEIITVEIVRDKLRIEVANTGTRTANAVKASLILDNLTKISYKDKLSQNKQTTFNFDIPKANQGKLILEYTGANNKRVTISEEITVPSNKLSQNNSDTGGSGSTLWVVAVIVIILAVVIYKFRKQF